MYSGPALGVGQGADDAAVEIAGLPLVFWAGPETCDVSTLVVGIESELPADGVVHDAASLRPVHHSIDAAIEQPIPPSSSFVRGPAGITDFSNSFLRRRSSMD